MTRIVADRPHDAAAWGRAVPAGPHGLEEAARSALSGAAWLSEHDRLLQVRTVLGPERLVAEHATIREACDTPFSIELTACSPGELPLTRLIGQQLSLALRRADDRRRTWHGYVAAAAHLGSDGGWHRWRLRLGSWLDFLALRRDTYLYQERTALEIVEDVFRDHPQARWRVEVTRALPRREICTQYRETDLDFVQRLLAEEGIGYHFEHLSDADGEAQRDGLAPQQARHCLVLTDRASPRPFLGPVRFSQPRDLAGRDARARAWEVDTLTRVRCTQRAHPTALALARWHPERLQGVAAEQEVPLAGAALPRLEHYDGVGERWLGGGAAQDGRAMPPDDAEGVAAWRAQVRADAFAQDGRRVHAQGTWRMARPGARFALVEHPSLGGEYLVLAVEHRVHNNLGARAAEIACEPELEHGAYRCELQAQPAELAHVPPPRPRPTAWGLQTALVVGHPGEPATTERDQRLKIQFAWQRGEAPWPGGLPHDESSPDEGGNAPGDARSGAWVRVAERAAGANWGSVFTARVGSEVLVDFIAGDIDRPVIVGQLYNGQDRPPLAGGQVVEREVRPVGASDPSGGFDGRAGARAAGDRATLRAANHPGVLSGWYQRSLGGAGHQEWVLDDATGQLRMRWQASHTLAELALGHLIQQACGSAWRGGVRGAGFEAGTQGWATLRAGEGLLVTTSARPGRYGSAESTQMDQAEAVAQLHAAQDLAERLGQAARHARALDLAPHAEATRELLRHLDPAQDGAYVGPVHGQDAHKLDAQRLPGDPVERPAAPTITFDTPCTLAQLSEASIVHYAAEDQAWVAQGDWHEAAAHTASLVAGGTASWYTHEGGIQLKAAHGPVSVRAHTDRLEILADQDVQILSVNDEIVVQAQQRIELVGGDSAVVLDGAHIDFITPGSFTVEAATHEWDGGSSAPAMLNPLPQGIQPIEAVLSPLQQIYARTVSLEEVPQEWLPRAIAQRVNGLHKNETLADVGVPREDVFSEPLRLAQPADLQLRLWSSSAWQVSEVVRQPLDDSPLHDEDRSEDDADL